MEKAPVTYNIFLIGFMGAGKSTIAKAFQQNYGFTRIEMDDLIEKQQGMTISEIFAKYGEAHFRDLESKCLIDLQKKNRCIISCGGGVVLRPENAEYMKKNGRVVLLTAKPETILERVRYSTSRPILNNHMNVGYIENLLNQRKDKYLAAADIIVPTDQRTADEICADILEQLRKLDSKEH